MLLVIDDGYQKNICQYYCFHIQGAVAFQTGIVFWLTRYN